jgi:hypothetical protein
MSVSAQSIAACAVNKSTLPQELRERPQWVDWHYEERDGKLTKVPYKPEAKQAVRASSTDPSTWGTLGAALAVADVAQYSGVGYVLTREVDTTFVDMDDCRDPQTGKIAPWAQRWIDRLNSYSEISPSGTGVHVFAHGHPPTEKGHKVKYMGGAMEMYFHARFATMTGNHLEGTPLFIEDRADVLAELFSEVFAPKTNNEQQGVPPRMSSPALTDQEVIDLCRSFSNGAKFSALMAGDTSYHGGDDSAADAALCSMLAFVTQDASQIERIFSALPLGRREKWTKRADYRRRTIDLALSGLREVYKGGGEQVQTPSAKSPPAYDDEGPPLDDAYYTDASEDYSAKTTPPLAETKRDRFLTAKEIAEATPEKPEWVIEPWIVRGGITELDAKIKAGKTSWALAACAAKLDGLDFMGYPTQAGPVVYLSEQPGASFREGLRRANLLERDDFHVLFFSAAQGLTWPQRVGIAKEKALEVGANFLVVDTLALWAGVRGEQENSTGDAQEAMEPLMVVAAGDNPVGVLVLRHERKSGGEVGDSARGSSAYGGSVDIVLALKRLEGNPSASPNMRVLHGLSRFDETPGELMIELTDEGYVALGDAHAHSFAVAKDAAMSLLREARPKAMTLDELLAAAQGVKRATMQNALETLQKQFVVKPQGAGKRGDPYRYLWVGD